MRLEVDGRLVVLVADERVAVQRRQRRREHRTHELPDACSQRAVTARQCVGELATHPIRAERFRAGDAGGIEHECGAQARGELCDAPERVGVGERTFELGLDDRVDVAWFVAAGVADGPLALGVGPAGAVGDQLAVVPDEQQGTVRSSRLRPVVR